MLARLVHTCRHLFTPHYTNNHRPKILYPHSLSLLAALVIITNSSIGIFAQVRGGILGYASDITVNQVLNQTNQRRTDQGLQPLKLNDQLSDAARRKAADMFSFDYWAHDNPYNHTTPWYFFDATGYYYRYAGENLARDFPITPPMVQAWMDSATHRSNILSPRYVDTGIAVVNGTLGGTETTIVVQLFGVKQQQTFVPQVSAQNTKVSEVSPAESDSAGQAPVSETKTISDQSTIEPSSPASAAEGNLTIQRRLLSPLELSKSVALATLGLVALVIIVDSGLTWYHKTHRLTGHNWAHLAFIAALMILLGSLHSGVIQ